MDARQGLIRVRIKDKGTAFDGALGSITGSETDGCMLMYRVRLDRPVRVPGLPETVTDDLWAAEWLELVSFEEEVDDGEEEGS